MPHRVTRREFLVLVTALFWLAIGGPDATPSAAAATTILESSLLRLEVTAAPYSYAVIEKSTGQVLLRQAETTFTAGTARAASTAAIGRKGANSLEATLATSGSSEPARVRWTFVDPAVLQVQLNQDKATSITEAFVDQGERNYGLWEYSYYGTGGALDNRGADNQVLLGLSGPPVGSGDPSGRAPLGTADFRHDAATGVLAIPLSGATSVQIRR